MSYTVRHQGSPRSIEGLNTAQVVEGLQDGLWDPTDEIMGPADSQWMPIESHPEFMEIALDLEPPPAKVQEDETRLDMNPLIDVALVLLIFFILTTSYAALQQLVHAPTGSSVDANKPLEKRQLSPDQVKDLMIKVEARKGPDGKTIIKVENEEVEERYLRAALSRYASAKQKTNLLIDAADDVDFGTYIAIQDAAKGANMGAVFVPKQQPAASR